MAALSASAADNTKNKGSITTADIQAYREAYKPGPAERAIHNAMAGTSINALAKNADAVNSFDTSISNRVPSRGITNQKSSGRCWLFTGLNVLRAQMMRDHGVPTMEFSQNYNFFWDQLEKANLFLQSIIDTRSLPQDDRTVDWLFQNPMSDGGQFTGLSDNLSKYGVVPAEVMAETMVSNNTSQMRSLLSQKLRQWGLELRRSAQAGASEKDLNKRKQQMLTETYRLLALGLGEPPTQFTWTRRDAKGNAVDTRTYTPQEFYNEYLGNNLRDDYVMFMNDPSRPFYKVYEIDLDRHTYDGSNWRYINLPIEEIKKLAIASILDSTAMYFSCDVGKAFDRERGVLDLDNYDYASLLGTDLDMNKADRITTHQSASTHAMTLVGVNLTADGTPDRWLIENSWGNGANGGHLIATDRWMDEYLFRLVVNKKYVPQNIADLLKLQPVKLPAWDPLFECDK